MGRRTGEVLTAVLIIAVVGLVFSGVLVRMWPAPELSPAAQQFLHPDRPVKTGWFTTLGTLKDQKQDLEIIKATAGVIDKEYIEKIANSQATYDKLIGSIDNPGLLGAAGLAALTGVLAVMYKNKTLYSEAEYQTALKTPPPTV